jgi:hypothetical protein
MQTADRSWRAHYRRNRRRRRTVHRRSSGGGFDWTTLAVFLFCRADWRTRPVRAFWGARWARSRVARLACWLVHQQPDRWRRRGAGGHGVPLISGLSGGMGGWAAGLQATVEALAGWFRWRWIWGRVAVISTVSGGNFGGGGASRQLVKGRRLMVAHPCCSSTSGCFRCTQRAIPPDMLHRLAERVGASEQRPAARSTSA